MILTIHLRHPLHDAPAEADVIGYWMQNGRNMGLEIAFPDGTAAN